MYLNMEKAEISQESQELIQAKQMRGYLELT